MKKIIILSIFILISLFLWLILIERKQPLQNESESVTQESEKKSITVTPEYVEERRKKQQDRREKIMKLTIAQANVPIEFWGKVVDHNGEPIEGVKIDYRVEQPRTLWGSNTVVKNIFTDGNGTFYIKDNGKGFSFQSFEKEGYRKTKGQAVSFAYSNSAEIYVPDKSEPKTYTLIKQAEMPGLIKSSELLRLNWDGLPVYYNLKTGYLGKSGEIKITALRGGVEGKGRQARYDWSFKVEALNGGVLETTRDAVYLAPEKGYGSSWEYGSLLSSPKWKSGKQGDTYLFFKLENGNYGQLQINFYTRPGRRTSGSITSYLNPSGGRILEYDGRLKVNP